MRQPTSILVYPAHRVRSEWMYLLMRRVRMPRLGMHAFWQGVTGAVEGKETLEQAAARELFEETGFAVQQLDAVGFSYTFPMREAWKKFYNPDVREITEHVFLAVVDDRGQELSQRGLPKPRLSAEHDSWQWCDFQSARTLLHWPENIEALRHCAARLTTPD